ncbi:MAG: ABC transporter substrate-binding protein, partial [Bacteroidetes bacterium]|nr:ABC transporter substrate-binding protein [Bacteroidota bacterium]
RDLTALVYSGLLKATPDGGLVPDLAKSYTISNDGLNYTFVLRDDITFHDGEPITIDDILFTIEKTQDPTLKSPKRANWDGVAVTKINGQKIQFILRQPYAPFLENTTLGILPRHLW